MTYDYDNAPTDPHHGGKMTAEQAAERIAAMGRDILKLVAMIEAHEEQIYDILTDDEICDFQAIDLRYANL